MCYVKSLMPRHGSTARPVSFSFQSVWQITHHLRLVQVTIYISAYVEATNRDAFMAVKQDLLQAFVDCCERNGARLARQRIQARCHPLICLHQHALAEVQQALRRSSRVFPTRWGVIRLRDSLGEWLNRAYIA